ncbi:hypothetical protein ScPMuIL_007759 [Solemya velum]
MSLYDGLDIEKPGTGPGSKSVVSGWSSNYKLLQSQLQVKKASLTQTKDRKQKQTTLAPVIDLKRQVDDDVPLYFNPLTGRIERDTCAPAIGGIPFIATEPVPSFTGVVDEYEPLRPNEYDDIMKKRREQRQKERDEDKKKDNDDRDIRDTNNISRGRDRDRDRDRDMDMDMDRDRSRDRGDRKKNNQRGRDKTKDDDIFQESEMDRLKRRREEEEEQEFEPTARPTGKGGAAIAPPQSLLEDNDSAMMDRANDNPNYSPLGYSIGLVGSVASKIMAKYGYKEGQGLGKKEQGMSTALFVEKTSKRGGKIIHEKDLPKDNREPSSNTNLLKNPSRVILLRNMVGPGEVDEELEPETAEECAKYGKVIKCLIFEIPGASDEEAVRIFLEFEKTDAAIKAVIDLNGRYFAGRTVKACCYNFDKFRRLDLTDDPDA